MPLQPAAGRLADGPLDIIGDVHGELGALLDLLAALGYGRNGLHPRGRRLVFVGDLCDRGPDSPGVVDLVARLTDAGLAQCVLGNHELNILRSSRKPGNGWYFPEDHDHREGRFRACQPADDAARERIAHFFATLPIALAREDLRIVHAAWHEPSLAAVGAAPDHPDLLGIYRDYAALAERRERDVALRQAAEEEYRQWAPRMDDEHAAMPLLTAIGRMNVDFQMSNPVRVLTSGVEQLAAQSFFASGKWRMVDRVAWWHGYQDPVPVIFGHYWRWALPQGANRYSRGERNLFAGVATNEWAGPRANAFCVDFSVGVRYRERPLADGKRFLGRLGAVRWPERELVFDDGETLPLAA